MPLLALNRPIAAGLGILVTCLFFGYVFVVNPPDSFPAHYIFTVHAGETSREVAQTLKQKQIIRSEFWFLAGLRLTGGDRKVTAGDYYFEHSLNLIRVIERFSEGDFGIDTIRITIREGSSRKEIGEIMAKEAIGFNKNEFLRLSEEDEGYLFPDTYFFRPTITPAEVIEKMKSNFNERIKPLQDQISSSTRSFPDILTMASILELEGATSTDRRLIAGVLWKRLDKGMPLQADAVFRYINGKGSLELTDDDLVIDSPYNVYKYKGLPPTPIANPGISAIEDALNPTDSKYFYFLSDKEGVMHYAETFEQHVANKNKYLK